MTTQPTPEQLAKWRELFHSQYSKSELPWMDTATNKYKNYELQKAWEIYLPCKQDNEQAIKDARKQALEEAIAILDDNKTNSTGAHITLNALRELLK